MPTIADLVPLVLLPAAIVLAARALAALARRRSLAAADGLVTLAIAAALCAVLHVRDVRPHLPLALGESPWERVYWIAPAAAIVGILEASARVPRLVRGVARSAVAGAAAWLVVSRIDAHWIGDAARWQRIVGAAIVMAAIWAALAAARDPGRRVAVAVSTVVGAGSGALIFGLVPNQGMAEALGSFSVAAGAAAAPLPPHFAIRLPAPAAALVSVVVGVVALSGHSFLNYGEVVQYPLATAALVAVSPAAGWLVPRGLRPVPAVALAALAALLVVGAAVLARTLLGHAPAPSGY